MTHFHNGSAKLLCNYLKNCHKAVFDELTFCGCKQFKVCNVESINLSSCVEAVHEVKGRCGNLIKIETGFDAYIRGEKGKLVNAFT